MSERHLGIGFVGGGFILDSYQSLIGVRNVDVVGVMSSTKKSAEESAALRVRLVLATMQRPMIQLQI